MQFSTGASFGSKGLSTSVARSLSLGHPGSFEAAFEPRAEGAGEGRGEVAVVAIGERVADYGAAKAVGADLGGELDQVGAGRPGGGAPFEFEIPTVPLPEGA